MPDQTQQLVQLLLTMMTRLDALEKSAHDRSAPSLPSLQDTLQAFAHGGPGPLGRVGNGADPGPARGEPFPSGPPLPGGPHTDVARGAEPLPAGLAPGQRPLPAPLPRSGIDTPAAFTIEVPAGRPYTPAPPPTEAAVAGTQFIRCVGDDLIQVRSEDGRLLGAMPSFPEDVQVVYTEGRQEMRVGMLASRAVVVPYNRGIDPRTIAGFIPAPGLDPGPLTTAPAGRGANLDNPDIGRSP